MTTHELEELLMQQPVSLLHRLARGRITRHFRSGKRKLVDLFLQASAENRPGLESDLQTLIDQHIQPPKPAPVEKTRPVQSPSREALRATSRPHRTGRRRHPALE